MNKKQQTNLWFFSSPAPFCSAALCTARVRTPHTPNRDSQLHHPNLLPLVT